jgi:hypothetical protein
MATGWPTKVSYANGDVFSASDINDTNGTINLLQTSTLSNQGGKNYLVNGGLDFWQRGTSFTATGYSADRFYTVIGGTTTVSQSTDVPTGVLAQYSLQGVTGAASSYSHFYQALESATVKPLQGKTVTLSVYVKTAGSYSGNFNLMANYSTSTDSWSGQSTNIFTTAYAGSAYTSWGRITATFTVPATAVGLRVQIENVSAQASGVTLRTCGWQLEFGSYATTFSRAGGTIQGELAACQRYYYRVNWDATSAYAQFGAGAGNSTTQVRTDVYFPVQLRKAPTAIDYPTVSTYFTYIKYDDTGGGSPSAVSLDTNLSDTTVGRLNWTGTSITAQGPYYVRGQNQTGAYLGWSAEL